MSWNTLDWLQIAEIAGAVVALLLLYSSIVYVPNNRVGILERLWAGKGSIAHGVRVLGLHPGATMTDRIISLNKNFARQKFGDESRWEELLKDVRMHQPAQVADTVVYLASARASHLTGIMVNLTPV